MANAEEPLPRVVANPGVYWARRGAGGRSQTEGDTYCATKPASPSLVVLRGAKTAAPMAQAEDRLRREVSVDSGNEAYEGFAVLELMGHRRLGGRVRQQMIGGVPFLRIDVPPVGENRGFTQLYAPAAIYSITPASEQVARAVAAQARHEPVSRYDLPELPSQPGNAIDVNALETEDVWPVDGDNAATPELK